jgi:hypothetical protein
MPTTAKPNLLQDPGYLFWAPLGSSVPAMTVAGSVFTDAWPVAWLSLGATEAGSTLTYTSQVQPVYAAEFFDPLSWRTTNRDGNIAFSLQDWTLTNVKRVFNGGSLSVVSGTGATTLSTFTPPNPGQEIRAMIGWESLDSTVRLVAYQTINSGTIASAFQKAPAVALLPCQFNFEVPTSGIPYQTWTAGTARG